MPSLSRAIGLILLGVLAGCCAHTAKPSPPSQTPHETQALELQDKTVALLAKDVEDRPRAFCSGVWVGDTAILTAFHCIASAEHNGFPYATHDDIYAEGYLHERVMPIARPAKAVAIDADHDLALLRTLDPPPAHLVALVAVDTVHPGSRVQTMGHAVGQWWSYSSGDVAAIRQYDEDEFDMLGIQTTAPISPGCSGGGLFDEQGNLVGLAHGSYPRGQNINVFAHAQYLAAFLRKQGVQ